MEATTLQRKKNSVNKGKIKKTMKNVLCRPDPMFWPLASDVHCKEVDNIMKEFKVVIPEFRKPHWSEIKNIAKQDRPKPPPIPKVDGLLFGISHIVRAITSDLCGAVILDGEINPKILVQNLIEACVNSHTPFICMKGLKKLSGLYFGVPTSSLAIKKGNKTVEVLNNKIVELSKCYPQIVKVDEKKKEVNNEVEMKTVIEDTSEEKSKEFTYLYRNTRKTRVFVPPTDNSTTKVAIGFIEQNFISFDNRLSEKPVIHRDRNNEKSYKNMIVKRITSNPNRNNKSKRNKK